MPIGVVITFDDAANKAWITLSESDLNRYIGHEASFLFSKTKDFIYLVLGQWIAQMKASTPFTTTC